MRKIWLGLTVASLTAASAVFAGPSDPDDRYFDLPKLTQPPVLDGERGADEWAGSLEWACSNSQIVADGAKYGWREQETGRSDVSANQLNQSEGEDASIARTDDDYAATIWQAWDDDGFYYITEVRDNVRDVVGGERLESWWERDSMSLYVDLINNKEESGEANGYVAMNIINFVAAPQNASAVNITWEYIVAGSREPTQDPDVIEGFTYGFRDAGDEFGGETDYVIEGMMPWTTLMRFNLPGAPTVGSEMGACWIGLDPDNDGGYGGQLQCWGWADDPSNYATWIFSDTPAGPAGGGTAVEADSWGRIKTTFN